MMPDACRSLLRITLLSLSCLCISVVWSAERVRPSALAGDWYPGDAEELADFVDRALDAAGPQTPDRKVRALVAPHAGYRYSGETAAQAFALVRGRTFERVILLAPSHRSPFSGLSISDVDAYETPLGRIPLDTQMIAGLRESPLVTANAGAHAREHSVEIELPMLQRALAPGWRLIPILVGRMRSDDYRIAANLLRPLADEGTLVVVSSDFTHYGMRFGFMPFPLDDETSANIRSLDDGALRYIEALDPRGLLDYRASTGITICGYRPIALLLHLLSDQARVHRIAYATSGALTGDYSSSVSYLALAVTAPEPISESAGREPAGTGDAEDELSLLHRLALIGVERGVLGPSEERGRSLEQALEELPMHLKEPAGAFVTLKRDGRLRGCIGYIRPRKPLFQAVLENGVNAAINDRRFKPVDSAELPELEVEVSVLSPPEPIASHEEFRVGDQGIRLYKGGRQAVFLPEVATEQGWSREETLSQLSRKAGLSGDAWREGASFEIFTSNKYSAPYTPTVAAETR